MAEGLNDGNTPLDPDEAEGLLPAHVETRGQLNEWEQANIPEAVQWLAVRRSRIPILSLEFCRALHRRMFGKTWSWAGEFRKRGKAIGIAPAQINEGLLNLMEDTRHQLAASPRMLKEIGARFHHRLVSIHPFASGNGRHARLMTDALMEDEGGTRFTWGQSSIGDRSARTRYIRALRSADRGDFSPLFEFLDE